MPATKWYPVYKLKFKLAMPDPDMPSPRFHTLIFVETNAQGPGSGTKHHVIGDIVTGMRYDSRPYHNPENSDNFRSKEFIGYINATTYEQRLDRFLEQIPAPPQQKAFNRKTMKTEPVKAWSPLTFYEPGERRRPLWKCTEWTEDKAIPALINNGLVVRTQ